MPATIGSEPSRWRALKLRDTKSRLSLGRSSKGRCSVDTFEQVEILLVEDNPHDAEFMTRALREGGFANRLHWVKDGQEALDFLLRDNAYAGREDSLPRLIFVDLKMPRVGGIELLQRIKADERTRH